ncbi:voltage-gated potassium channel [Spinactinospora alkalitolerans]|uniref:Voltage-gated potassium channel n=1 Tax=Spinactinospora alkalitolerans TaxID=687207 RepID=A0A852TXD5_9ACTN|nr:potassium channel family protein [Spinactinospora alkalitolerans]NYE46704.1 voltage-gated potassium channel [Spinactinospora alkalitolerans]
MRSEAAFEAWRRRTIVPVSAAALLFLAAYAWPILDPALDRHWEDLCALVLWGSWALFACDYLTRFWLAPRRVAFVRRHLFDLAIVAVPFLRPLVLLQLASVLNIMNRRVSISMRGNVARYAAAASLLVVFCAALAVLDAERGAPEATITTFTDALWWSATTVTTVGYGDMYPVTAMGRLVAIGLFIAGIALLGVVTGTLASWFVERIDASQETAAATQAQVDALTIEVRALRAELRGDVPGTEPERSPPM